MPTRRKRHSITETDDVAAVLDRVRGATGGELDLPELVKLGGEAKLRTLAAEGIDIDALHEVRERGWARG
jgi:hypothetical protein